jgi:hypothetical protein
MGSENVHERFTRLLIQHEPAILRHVMVAVPNRADARDVLQERTVNVTSANAPFEWIVQRTEFVPTEPVFPLSPVGLEIVECWCLTLHMDHGLVVESMELRSDR